MNVNDVIREINKDKINLIFYLAVEQNNIIECVFFTDHMCYLSDAEEVIDIKFRSLHRILNSGGNLESKFNYYIQCDSASYKIFNNRKELNDNILSSDGYKICFIYSEADNEITMATNNNVIKITS